MLLSAAFSRIVVALVAIPVGAAAIEPVPCDLTKGACWTPPVGARWQYQLEPDATGGINVDICTPPFGGGTCVTPEVYDIDLYAADGVTPNAAGVQTIHARGRRAICYVSAGTIETFRPDYPEFVAFDQACGGCLIGNPFSEVFPDEFWANLNDDRGQRTFLKKVIKRRVQKCKAAGFDGVELDVVNAWEEGTAVTGWNISAETQLLYNRKLANMTHRQGLTVALKNDLGQLEQLRPYFDYAVNEQCFEFDECDEGPSTGYRAWIDAGKAVFTVEYRLKRDEFCAEANAAGYSSIKKKADFSLADRPWKPCR